MWLQAIIAILRTVAATIGLVEKTLPSPELKAEMYRDEKPLLEVKQRLAIENKIFRRIKNNPEADIAAEVRYVTNLNPQDERDLITNLTARVEEHRRDHPLLSGMRRFERNKRK